MPQSQPQPTLDTKRKRKRTKTYTRKKKQQTNVRETQRPAPSSPSEVIRMLKQTEKRGQRAREDFKTLSAPWYKPQSYAELRTKPGPPSNRGAGGGRLKYFYRSTYFTFGPDVIHNTKIRKQFSSRNGSLTQINAP